MDNFIIISNLTKGEYAKVMFLGTYKKPVFILSMLFGFYLLLFHESNAGIILGLLFILNPAITPLLAVSQFNSNPRFKGDIKYTFSEDGVIVEGTTCKSEFSWKHIIKQKEISDVIILYHNERMGNFIDKRKLSLEQLKFIKDKINRK